jgi:hypothetical protein
MAVPEERHPFKRAVVAGRFAADGGVGGFSLSELPAMETRGAASWPQEAFSEGRIRRAPSLPSVSPLRAVPLTRRR